MIIPPHLTDDERQEFEIAHSISVLKSSRIYDRRMAEVELMLFQKLSDARATILFCDKKLSDVGVAHPEFYVLDALNMIDKTLAGAFKPATASISWDGLCWNKKHGLDYEGQKCDLCPSELKHDPRRH